MRWLASALIALALVRPAAGQEPAGCDKFKWPLDHERAIQQGVPEDTDLFAIPKDERKFDDAQTERARRTREIRQSHRR